MNHWTDKYIGLTVKPEVFDCADLAEKVVQETFGKSINLPKDREYAGQESVAKFKAMAHQISLCKEAYAEPTDFPEDGNGVLLYTRGYHQHIGIYAKIHGEGWVLHACDMRIGPQVVLQRIRDLAIRGIKVEGYYKWR